MASPAPPSPARCRALAVSGDKRSTAFPDLPTIAEAGVPGYSAPTWTSLVGPAGLPKAIVDKLNAAVNRAIRSEGFKTRFAAIGDEPAGGTPQDLADTIAKDSAKWKGVVERVGREAGLSELDVELFQLLRLGLGRFDPFLHLRQRHDRLAIGGAGRVELDVVGRQSACRPARTWRRPRTALRRTGTARRIPPGIRARSRRCGRRRPARRPRP